MPQVSDSRTPSIWLDTAEVPSFAPLTEDVSVDVAVVGGGLVGVVSAYLLAKSGLSVGLFEGRRILHGVSGNTTAKVSASHGMIYEHLRSQFNEGKAQLYAEANMQAIDWIEEHARDAHFRRKDLVLYGEDDKTWEALHKEGEAARAAGIPCDLQEKLSVPFPTHGGLVFPNMAEFHPVKFAVPLLQDAVAAQCKVFENTMLSEVDEHETTTLKTLDGHSIRARDVVIATHFPFFDPAFYYARLDAFRDYAIAVEMPDCLPQMYVGAGEGYTYRCEGDLLIVSGGAHKVGKNPDTEKQYSDMEQFVRDHFGLSKVRHRWSSQDNSSLDKVPYIGKISADAEHVWVACGFGGWGMTTSIVAAQLLTSLIRGQNPAEADLYSPLRFKPLASAPTLGTILADSVRGLVGKRLFGGSDTEPEEMKPGQAEVVSTKEGKVGAFCDEQGVVHAVSAVCTHMGCILAWNNAERSWDCPCHGSRFDHEGKVLHGPAVSPLKKVEVD